MTRKKMNSLITLGFFALYIICLGISFSTCSTIIGSVFQRDGRLFVENTSKGITAIQLNQENKPKNFEELTASVSENAIQYPYAYAIYDENGDIAYKSNEEFCYYFLDREIQTRLYQQIESDEMSQKAKYAIENYSGGGGCFASDVTDCHAIFELNGEKYYFYVITKHSIFFDTLVSYYFKSNTINQTILFGVVAIFVFVVANKLFKKNKVINETREAFTSAAAHELKTPITIINNQCECLLNNTAPEKSEEYIETIYKQNKQMSHLVSNLLQYNRLSLATIEKSEFDIKEIIEAELEKYEALIESKGIILETNISSCTINGDKDLITLVIDNFLSNAIKHTKEGKKIVVTNYYKKLIVFNEGSKISEEDKNKIWEVFNHSINESKSTGMGLAISKKILELHKFDYGFENKANGVEFYFYAR